MGNCTYPEFDGDFLEYAPTYCKWIPLSVRLQAARFIEQEADATREQSEFHPKRWRKWLKENHGIEASSRGENSADHHHDADNGGEDKVDEVAVQGGNSTDEVENTGSDGKDGTLGHGNSSPLVEDAGRRRWY
ncbi:hypothetical protein EJ04DRAFT_559283 [Polyplosphaeria fusca]|uniref:Uncharacterized protein n=1 Tax=Polyplosphaeria fusca TaxID=682080 RepID=A0A9P4R7E2_9PLEO|nr:hypothetical protein EJ04DRAFT_559283 [Polyplosphaeria fusca]